MELDELKAAWRALDRRLEREHALNFARFKDERLARVRGALRPLAIGQAAQALGGALLIAWFAPFWVEHRALPHLLLMGLLGHAWALALILLAGRDLHAISQIDYAAPVLAIQKGIAELRARRIRVAPFHAITGCFIWIPMVLVLFRKLGADVWALKPEVVYWFIASGFVCLVPLLAFMRWSRSPKRARLAKTLDDDAAGRSMNRAQAMLEEVARFEAA